jgi:hypothetical protein
MLAFTPNDVLRVCHIVRWRKYLRKIVRSLFSLLRATGRLGIFYRELMADGLDVDDRRYILKKELPPSAARLVPQTVRRRLEF